MFDLDVGGFRSLDTGTNFRNHLNYKLSKFIFKCKFEYIEDQGYPMKKIRNGLDWRCQESESPLNNGPLYCMVFQYKIKFWDYIDFTRLGQQRPMINMELIFCKRFVSRNGKTKTNEHERFVIYMFMPDSCHLMRQGLLTCNIIFMYYLQVWHN